MKSINNTSECVKLRLYDGGKTCYCDKVDKVGVDRQAEFARIRTLEDACTIVREAFRRSTLFLPKSPEDKLQYDGELPEGAFLVRPSSGFGWIAGWYVIYACRRGHYLRPHFWNPKYPWVQFQWMFDVSKTTYVSMFQSCRICFRLQFFY